MSRQTHTVSFDVTPAEAEAIRRTALSCRSVSAWTARQLAFTLSSRGGVETIITAMAARPRRAPGDPAHRMSVILTPETMDALGNACALARVAVHRFVETVAARGAADALAAIIDAEHGRTAGSLSDELALTIASLAALVLRTRAAAASGKPGVVAEAARSLHARLVAPTVSPADAAALAALPLHARDTVHMVAGLANCDPLRVLGAARDHRRQQRVWRGPPIGRKPVRPVKITPSTVDASLAANENSNARLVVEETWEEM